MPNIYAKTVNTSILSSQGSSVPLNRALHPRKTEKNHQSPAKPLTKVLDLAHAMDERYALAFAPAFTLSVSLFLSSSEIFISLLQN